MLPVHIVGNYQRHCRSTEDVYKALRFLVPCEWNVDPDWHPTDEETKAWHQDCNGNDQYLVVWSDHTPTPVRLMRKVEGFTLPQRRAGDIILIDNLIVQHRTPILPDFGKLSHRMFARARIQPYRYEQLAKVNGLPPPLEPFVRRNVALAI